MRRMWLLALVILMILGSAGTDLFACGDKFLRVGRSPRFRGYASVYPSSILVYAPRWTRHGISDFEQMLKHGGHHPVTVTTSLALSQAFNGGKYAVVITSYADVGAVAKEMDAMSSRPALLPLVYKASKTQTAEAAAAYRCLLRPEKMTPFQALEEIDRLIELRLKDQAATSAAK